MADSAITTTPSKFNRRELFKSAHKAAREQFTKWPWQRKQLTYREMFAAELRRAYRAARSQTPKQVVVLSERRQLIQMKTRLSAEDWADIHSLDRQIATLREAA